MQGRFRWLVMVLVVALFGAACGGDDDDSASEDDGAETTSSSVPEEDEGQAVPEFAAGSGMAALQGKGKLVVGTKFDQPGFGFKNPTGGQVEGFDVEIAKIIASEIFGGTAEEAGEKIEFLEAQSQVRETFITEGRVDLVVATYTINDTRKQQVDFAGPYFFARQDLMVKADDDSITKVEDLAGKKVCSVQGSTSLKNLQAKVPTADVSITFPTYSECASALGDDRVVAVTTDDTILAGLVKASGGDFKLVGSPFSEEPYGIGLKKGATDLRNFINDILEEIYEDGRWVDAFQNTLGKLDLATPEPPPVVRY
jgi:glutamate transport system substrate-binding protein